MRKLDVFNAIAILLLVATLLLLPIAEAATWSSPSMVTDPNLKIAGFSGCQSISGDGSKIAFVAGIPAFYDAEIFVVNSDGTGLTKLTNNTEFDNAEYFGAPSINYDGSKIVFDYDDRQSGGEIFTVNSDGTGLKQVTDFKTGPGCSDPAISGDGSRIAFRFVDFTTWNRGIFVINSDGTGEKQLTDSDYFDEQPSISYDGSKIAFLGADDFDFQYFVINSDGTGLTKLTQNTNNWRDVNNPNGFPPSGPSISADGSKVAFEGYVGEDTEIFVINSDGTGLRQLTDNAERDWAPAISGDGNRIVFQRSPSLNPMEEIIGTQIFVISSDGTGLTKLTDDSERVFMFPSISDNGEEIAVWNNFCSGDEFESAVSLISYLPDAEGENPEFTDDFEDESTFPVAMVVGGVLTVALGAMVILYLKKKPRKI